jgi:hypothetical protein
MMMTMILDVGSGSRRERDQVVKGGGKGRIVLLGITKNDYAVCAVTMFVSFQGLSPNRSDGE